MAFSPPLNVGIEGVERPVAKAFELYELLGPNELLVLGSAELGPHAPLSHVLTPSRGKIQVCNANQAPMSASGIQISLMPRLPAKFRIGIEQRCLLVALPQR